MKREPAVEGQFYPSNIKELERLITSFVPKPTPKVLAKGVILPHAGYIYSGKVAASTVARIIPKKRLIILGPNHTGMGELFSVYPEGWWSTPMGDIEIDAPIVDNILKQEGYLKKDYAAHKFEHSIEVELPILKYFFKDFKFVPIVCGTANLEVYKKVAHQIYEGIKEVKDEVIIIASGDMTHYEPEAIAREKDRFAIESIINLDEKDLLKRVKKKNISMCGVATVPIMLIVTKLLGATKAEVVLYQTSGEVSGDYTAVVGYLGAIIS